MTENTANNLIDSPVDNNQRLLPNFCNVRNIFILVLLTELLAIIFAVAAAPDEGRFWGFLAMSSLLMLWTALLNAAVLCKLGSWLNRQDDIRCMVFTFLLMMSVSLIVAVTANIATEAFIIGTSRETEVLFIVRVLTVSAVIYFLLLRYLYVQHQWRLNLAAQSRAEVQALRARIRPHFLFNSMNTIASLITISPEIAEKAIEDLSDLFRASLSEQNMSRLGDEIELTKSYLAIETLRLGDRLQLEFQVDEKLLDTEVPSLCIQPLAENAVYHGIEPIAEGGKILISALQIDNKLKLSVCNPLLSDKQASTYNKKGNQMAQDNIRQRLKLVYGNNGEFIINDTKDNYTVSLLIPLDVIHERFDS